MYSHSGRKKRELGDTKEKAEIDKLFNEIHADIEELSKIEQKLYELAIKNATQIHFTENG